MVETYHQIAEGKLGAETAVSLAESDKAGDEPVVLNQLGPSGVKGDVRTDAAYVKSPKSRYVIAICARRVRDKTPTADNQALVTGAAVSRIVYDYFNAGRPSNRRP